MTASLYSYSILFPSRRIPQDHHRRALESLDLEDKVFTLTDPHRIATSLKRSAERSKRRKGAPYQSAMSMLDFYINRAGTGLSGEQKSVLTRAEEELRKVFHKTAQ